MGKLHELLAVEKEKNNALNKLVADTHTKFKKFEYFQGHVKTLKMIEDSAQNNVIEQSAYEDRQLPTTVHETLDYVFQFWKQAEDITFQKNKTNQHAVADIVFRDEVIAKDVPVDELMGLEVRLDTVRKVFDAMPTLPAGVKWEPDNASGRPGSWVAANKETTTKTEKTMVPVVLYEATDKHPAQVKESTVDKTIGSYTLLKRCGAATSAQKAECIALVDDLICCVKQARMRANSVQASTDKIGQTIVDILMRPFVS